MPVIEIDGKANLIVKLVLDGDLTKEEKAWILLDLEQTLNTMGEQNILISGKKESYYPRFHITME